MIVWGSGNSADTLLEFIGNIFQGENPLVRRVTKVYLISEKDLSARPRYALISDIKARGGRGNLVEQVRGRVVDLDFATNVGDPESRQVIVYDADGQVIKDNEGNPIMADSAVAATGFSPRLEKIFESYLKGRTLRDKGENAPLTTLSLPTNPEVSVAEYFKDDPSIVILGTASNPRFTGFPEKLAQLPPEAKNALLRNGAENAVAIGFRAPDTQAAINIWLNSRTVNLESQASPGIPKIPASGPVAPGAQIDIERTVPTEGLDIPDNLGMDDLLLSPLLTYNIGNMFQLEGNFSGNLEFELTYSVTEGKFILKYREGDLQGISSELATGILMAAQDEYFQRYSLNLLGKRRRNPRLDLSISFKNGRINPQNTYVQAV